MFEDKVETEQILKKNIAYRFVKIVLIIAIICSLVLIYAVFFPKDKIPSFQEKENNSLILTGQDGLYFIELPKLKINLKSNKENFSFIETSIALELAKPSYKSTISALLPRILDAINTYLREMSIADLHESGSLYQIKEALLERINFLIAPAHINDILFKELFVGQGQ